MSNCDACDAEERDGNLHGYDEHTCGIASPMDWEARRLARETGMHWEPGMHGPSWDGTVTLPSARR